MKKGQCYMQYQLRFSGKHFQTIQQHLFPGDGKEAVAVVLCGRFEKNGLSILLTHKVELIPHKECIRDNDKILWKTDRIIHLIETAEKHKMAILKIHSHPNSYPYFSKIDDVSDSELFKSVFGWCEYNGVHGSVIMLPDGIMFGRVFTPELKQFPINKISVAGDEISILGKTYEKTNDEFSLRTVQSFGEGTYTKLRDMTVGVIGCSGTGSPTIEQLVRLGVSTLVIVDPDRVEKKNLNRIINSTMANAVAGTYKVKMLSKSIKKIGLGTKIISFASNLFDNTEILNELIKCDVIFGCIDSVDGRHLLSQLTNFYLIPYFDIGVRLDADGKGGIKSISANVHYIQPGCSTLLSRGLYTEKRLFEDGLLRQDPEEFAKREKVGYVHNANVDRPAVISINMQISSMAVNEFLNRLHPFKEYSPGHYAKVMMDYCDGCIENAPEWSFVQDKNSDKWAGRGDCKPFLRMPELSV
ncbi:ThiF family adenylyltransferase [Candidatus Nomurabacteria bacterium]|nr:ThiF family adenylyltransferase [Candidatus Nomurabacteria bacterium]